LRRGATVADASSEVPVFDEAASVADAIFHSFATLQISEPVVVTCGRGRDWIRSPNCGGQEHGLRGGTENVPYVAGLRRSAG